MDSQVPHLHFNLASAPISPEGFFLLFVVSLILILFTLFTSFTANLAFAEDTGAAVLVGDEVQSDGSVLRRDQEDNDRGRQGYQGVLQAGGRQNTEIRKNNIAPPRHKPSHRQRERVEKKMTWDDS